MHPRNSPQIEEKFQLNKLGHIVSHASRYMLEVLQVLEPFLASVYLFYVVQDIQEFGSI
jgi:hypothetical protein